MRIATWNVNGIRARHDYVALWLKERQPDVVGFQELKAEDDQFPHAVFNSLGYEVHTHGQKSWNGVAIASRVPVEITQRGLPGEEANGARLITAAIDDLSYTSVYVPNGKNPEHDDFQMKLRWYESLSKYWQEVTKEYPSAAIGGDYNIVPFAVDSHRGEEGDGEMYHTAAEREVLHSFVANGLYDIFRELNPDSNEFSWWDYRAGAFQRGMGLRIDMIYGTEAVNAHATAAYIDRDFRKKQDGMTASDHAPVYLDID